MSGGNDIYTNDIDFYGAVNENEWNISKTTGTNIVGGPYLGGNFWEKADGTGFSETCSDIDEDGICDESYVIATKVKPSGGDRKTGLYTEKTTEEDFLKKVNYSEKIVLGKKVRFTKNSHIHYNYSNRFKKPQVLI